MYIYQKNAYQLGSVTKNFGNYKIKQVQVCYNTHT